MKNNKTHAWDVTPKDAIAIQKELRSRVSLVPLKKEIKTIAGADVSLNMFGKDLYAGIIVLSYPDLIQVDQAFIKIEAKFPYIPGLLSFREIPGLLLCWEKLQIKPDLVMVDGQGIAHPRRLGIATHFGILANVSTIGVGKSVLTGNFTEPTEVGTDNPLVDVKTDEIIGAVFKSKNRSKPLIISPGHLITLKESLSFVKKCLKGYRLPEPTRRAHLAVNVFRKSELHLK